VPVKLSAQVHVRLSARASDPIWTHPGRGANPERATNLLPELHDLESLKVVELLPLLVLGALLCPCGLCPLLVHLGLCPCRLDGADSGSAGKLGENDRGEGEVGESCGVAGDNTGL
jgi:hypothetical protein